MCPAHYEVSTNSRLHIYTQARCVHSFIVIVPTGMFHDVCHKEFSQTKETKKESVTRLRSAALATTLHTLHSTVNGGQTKTLATHWSPNVDTKDSCVCKEQLKREPSIKPNLCQSQPYFTGKSFNFLL